MATSPLREVLGPSDCPCRLVVLVVLQFSLLVHFVLHLLLLVRVVRQFLLLVLVFLHLLLLVRVVRRFLLLASIVTQLMIIVLVVLQFQVVVRFVPSGPHGASSSSVYFHSPCTFVRVIS